MTKPVVITGLLLFLFVSISVAMTQIPADTLVSYVGSDRAVLLMFVLGLVGGFTTFSGVPYHFILMSLAAGGATPWLLGLSTAFGVMIGDSVMFGISKRASHLVPGRVTAWLKVVAQALETRPKLLTPALILYGSISPFSNDFVVASLTLMGYSYRRIIIPLTIGNIFYNITLAYIGYYYYDVVIRWFG